jgi:hypothetical protein
MYLKYFDVPIYNSIVYIVLVEDFNDLKNCELSDIQEVFEDSNADGLAIDHEEYTAMVFNTKSTDFNIGMLAHECDHITNIILQNKGVKTTQKNDEAHAYLLQYIMNKTVWLVREEYKL